MKYALGNMLNGAGGLNADGLALDLQFAADKTLTARKGPTPVFTRASTATFVDINGLIQSSAINAARFDHDPVTLACRGLLIEETRTNLLIRSADFTSSAWVRSGVTTTQVTSLDGSSSATLFNDGTSTTEHSFSGAFSVNRPIPGAVTCSLSCFLKAGSKRYLILSAGAGPGGGVGIAIDTQSWSITDAKSITAGWIYTSSRLTDYGNGWYRAELVFTPPAATPVITRLAGSALSTFTATGPSYTGANETFTAWGIQLETAAFASSYIPTVASSVIRSADVCSITGSAFTGFYNQSEGTVLVGHPFRNNSLSRSFYIGDGTNSTNTLELFSGSPGIGSNAFSGGAQQYGQFVFAANNSMAKASLAVAPSNAMLAVNGTLGTPGGGLMPVGPNQLIIGNRPDGARNINGHIPFFRYYRKRLANAKLQALTT